MINTRTLLIGGLIIAILIGVAAVFFASGDPDGLESTALVVQGEKTLTGDTPPNAEVQENTADTFSYTSLMPDYSLGEEWGPAGGAIAIVIGILLAFSLAIGIAYTMKIAAKPNK
jgi:cobalt/nickel transport protein